MGRREDDARLAGMMYAYKQIKAHGMDYFERELKNRGAYHIAAPLTNADLGAAAKGIREQTYDTMLVMSLLTLHDEFGFGHDRLARFIERFNIKTESLAEGYTTWDEQLKILADECKVYLDIRFNGEAGEEVIRAS